MVGDDAVCAADTQQLWCRLESVAVDAIGAGGERVVAARQWQRANEIALDDPQQLPRQDWTAVAFHEFIADPAETVRRLCEFTGVRFDEALQARTAGALPQSRSTHTPPAVDKWRRNEAAIERVLPAIEPCYHRLRALR